LVEVFTSVNVNVAGINIEWAGELVKVYIAFKGV
jgi:hypothetical protein